MRVRGTIITDGIGGATIESGSVNVAGVAFVADDNVGHVAQVTFTAALPDARYQFHGTFYSPTNQYLWGTCWPWVPAGASDGRAADKVTFQISGGSSFDPATTIVTIMFSIP